MNLKQIGLDNWWIPVGKTRFNRSIWFPLHLIPHWKVGGVTNSGKTQFLKWVSLFLLKTKPVSRVKLVIGDFKEGASFSPFRWWPNVEVYKRQADFLKVLKKVYEEMNTRLAEIENKRMWFKAIPDYERIVVIVDECSELSPALAVSDAQKEIRKTCHEYLSSIARIGREAHIHLILSTQRPDKDSIPPNYRGQLEAVFCFRVQSDKESEIILQHPGAEKLPWIPGRFIYQTPLSKEIEVQAPYVPDRVIQHCAERFMIERSKDNQDTEGGKVSTLSTPGISSDWDG